ncbi:MAG: SMP-30/gluconolactonase/LRE family protein [Ferrimicrobium sp.]
MMGDRGEGEFELRWEVAIRAHATLGEHPVWDERLGMLTWVDIPTGEVHRYLPGSGDEVFVNVGSAVGAVGLLKAGGYVAATARGFLFIDDAGRVVSEPLRPLDMAPDAAFNDGACDPCGRFWAGTAATDSSPSGGRLYRLDVDLGITTVLDGVMESNGIGWSPDARTMYYVDSGETDPVIRAFAFDCASGTIASERKLVVVPHEWGVPDGLVVDATGCLWVAFWGNGSIRRFTPSGEILGTYPVPVPFPTCPAFGGEGLSDLYIATARGERESEEAGAGDIFRATVPVMGSREHRFG